jgi:hypothetical protein
VRLVGIKLADLTHAPHGVRHFEFSARAKDTERSRKLVQD